MTPKYPKHVTLGNCVKWFLSTCTELLNMKSDKNCSHKIKLSDTVKHVQLLTSTW